MINTDKLSEVTRLIKDLGYDVSFQKPMFYLNHWSNELSATKFYDIVKKVYTDDVVNISATTDISIDMYSFKYTDLQQWIQNLTKIYGYIEQLGIDISKATICNSRSYNNVITIKEYAFQFKNLNSLQLLCKKYNAHRLFKNRLSISPEFDEIRGIVIYAKKHNDDTVISDDLLLLECDFVIDKVITEENKVQNKYADNYKSRILAEIQTKFININNDTRE